ncbi:hypothetical protein chmu016 [Choristoneura murinana nucleopolyhedrovirus]|uniref:Uncharacterized protein n=1 Tax=Choristoneura murinana nucleopolyhedrovirus TaxID=1987479 RepID=V9XV90_9ABAC|nr:hypothetical protein chmu016 [Choristoneura murinana nucleopolyhedrovirus]AHD25503.1 hypothetical protein chmu016 [Choristoneura murinana nucleopolyhedrovirus]BBU37495.1 hypothetical protein [Choristoneura diversana nucleopolyhedrovirus]
MFVVICAYIPFVVSGALSKLIACVMRSHEAFCARPHFAHGTTTTSHVGTPKLYKRALSDLEKQF